jgi:hypothetical protein
VPFVLGAIDECHCAFALLLAKDLRQILVAFEFFEIALLELRPPSKKESWRTC